VILFCTSVNRAFLPGAVTLVKSIRRFYRRDEARIHVHIHRPDATPEFLELMRRLGAAVKFMTCDARKIGKAVATRVGVFSAFDKVVHIDCDAWLLSRIDEILAGVEPDTVLCWNDREGSAIRKSILHKVFSVRLKNHPDLDVQRYNVNAGIVIYGTGTGTKRLATEFENKCRDPKINDRVVGNQGILRCLLAKYELAGKIRFIHHMDADHWNPIWDRANKLEFKDGEWFNLRDGCKQYIIHAGGGKNKKIGQDKPWQRPEVWSEDILACYEWANEFEPKEPNSEEWWDDISHGYEENGRDRPEEFNAAADVIGWDSVLEIGCATGDFSKYCSHAYVGVDISQEMVEQARSRFPGRVFIHSPLQRLPDGFNGAFDWVAVFQVLEHFDKITLAGIMQRLMRMATKGLVFSVPRGQPSPADKIADGHLIGWDTQDQCFAFFGKFGPVTSLPCSDNHFAGVIECQK